MPITPEKRLISAAFEIQQKAYVDSHADIFSKGLSPSDKKGKKIAQNSDVEYVGSGGEVFVLAMPHSPEILFAVNHYELSPNAAKSIYYRQRILSTLFPHNFPRIYGATGYKDVRHPQEDITGTIRQRIRGKPRFKHFWQEDDNFSHIDRSSKYPFKEAWLAITALELPLKKPDLGGQNFILGSDGGVYYVDILEENRLWGPLWNLNLIVKFMDENTYGSGAKNTVLNSISRLRSLRN